MESLRALRVRAFRRLALSYSLNELSWGFGTVALALLVYDRTHAALAPTALFLATTFVPALVAPGLTARIDRTPARRSLPALYLIEAALFGLLALVAGHFSLPLVLALALFDGTVAVTARALTRSTVVAALRPAGQLENGNRLLNLSFSLAFAGGPALAGLVVARAGIRPSLLITAGLFAVMAVTLATGRALPDAAQDAVSGWWRRLRHGLGHVRENRDARRVIVAHLAAGTALTMLTPIEVVYARRTIGGSDATYGLLLGAWGAGTVLSALLLAASRRRLSALTGIPLAAGLTGTGEVVMALAPSLWVAIVGCAVAGIGNGLYYVTVVQGIQEQVPDAFQARVMGLLESANALTYGAGYLLGGALTALFAPRAAIAVSAAGVLAAASGITLAVRAGRAAAAAPPAEPAHATVSPAPTPAPAAELT